MIIFKGELSEKNKKYIWRKNKLGGFFAAVFVAILSIIPITLLMVYMHWIFCLAFFPLVLLVVLSLIPYKDDKKFLFPLKILIYDGLVINDGKDFKSTRKVSHISKIIDFEDCYYFHFSFPHKDCRFLCQKDLITEGTIEEFENLFKDKIIKK